MIKKRPHSRCHKGSFALILVAVIASRAGSQVADSPATGIDAQIRVIRHTPPASIAAYWTSLPERHPTLPGFRAPITDSSAALWPSHAPDDRSPAYMHRAARIVAERLAIDGLPLTLARVVEVVGLANLNRGEAEDADLLRRTGLPVDLLAYYPIPGASSVERYPIVRYVQQLLASGRSADELADTLRALPFVFRKSSPEFRATSESEDRDIALVRLQLPRGDYWRGIGDGSGLDVCRQLIEVLPDAQFLVSIEAVHVNSFLGFARLWLHESSSSTASGDARLTVIAEKLPVAEWAQDNGKMGILTSAADGTQRPATLAPRYANRGEEGTILVPGENLLLDGLRAAGHAVIQSPLLFQGGNVILATDPRTATRYLLIGEAEIYRNVALGLTRKQVSNAFAVEFDAGVEIEMFANSYHIDYEVSLRSVGGGLVAFVNDTTSAVAILLRTGARALRQTGLLDDTTSQTVDNKLAADDILDAANLLRAAVDRHAVRPGQYPESLAAHFSTSLVDPGVANFQHFLLAMDLATALQDTTFTPSNEAYREYLDVLRRRHAERAALRHTLESLGIKVVAVPSLAEGDRSLNYLNGIHARGKYLMPACGGLYADLDRAAVETFRREFGNQVEVIPVYCAESQRRYGALRCAAAAY